MRIGIVGIGITDFKIHKEPFYNVAFEAAKRALEDAGIERGGERWTASFLADTIIWEWGGRYPTCTQLQLLGPI